MQDASVVKPESWMKIDEKLFDYRPQRVLGKIQVKRIGVQAGGRMMLLGYPNHCIVRTDNTSTGKYFDAYRKNHLSD